MAIFDTPDLAHDAARAIQQVDAAAVHLHHAAIIKKDRLGFVSVLDANGPGVSWGGLAVPLVGGIVGLLVGPVGVAAGLLLGGLVGRVVDTANQQNEDFLAVADRLLGPGDAAIVAEAEENAPETLDAAVARYGGRVDRRDHGA